MGDVHLRGAIFEPDGRLRYVHDTISEADTWTVALGWPDAEEIAWHKDRGLRFARVRITEDGGDMAVGGHGQEARP